MQKDNTLFGRQTIGKHKVMVTDAAFLPNCKDGKARVRVSGNVLESDCLETGTAVAYLQVVTAKNGKFVNQDLQGLGVTVQDIQENKPIKSGVYTVECTPDEKNDKFAQTRFMA